MHGKHRSARRVSGTGQRQRHSVAKLATGSNSSVAGRPPTVSMVAVPRRPFRARAYVSAAVALTAASVVAVAPVAPPPPDVKAANLEVRLTASSIANVPVNLFYAIANVPANEVEAWNNWADALEAGGSWWLKTPTNVWGWDPGNPPMLQALVSILVPFPVISGNGGLPNVAPGEEIGPGNSILGGSAAPGTLGYILNVIIAANAPMHPNCGFECSDLLGALGGYFQVPITDLLDGYTFPVVENPNSNPGDPYPPAWSGQTIGPIDPLEPFTNFLADLMKDPSENELKPVSFEDIYAVGVRNFDAGMVAFDQFVPGSYLFTGAATGYGIPSLFGGVLNGLVSRICPSCVPSPPASVTSIPSPMDAARTFTLDTATVAPGDDAGKKLATGHEMQSPNGLQDIQAGAATLPDAASPVAEAVDAVPQTLPAEEDQGPSARVKDAKLPLPTTSTNLTTDGNKFVPGKVGANRTQPGERLAGAVKSVTDGINSVFSGVSNAISGMTGGPPNAPEAESNEAGTDGAE